MGMTPPSTPPSLQAHHIIDLYCWLDDLVPRCGKRTGRPALLSEAEVLTILVWNALALRQKTLKDLHRSAWLYHRQDFRLPAYPTFVAQCHRALPAAFALLSELLADNAPIRLMDSTMLPVCKLHRADAYKTAKNLTAFGKNHQGFHYGFKLHASIDLKGRLAGLALTGANVYDAQAMLKILNEHCRIAMGDTLYGARVMGKKVRDAYGTVIIAPPWPKQNKKVAAPWQIELLNLRSKIESVFDVLKEHLHLVSSFPRSVAGYLVHYVRVLLGYQIMALVSRG
jgi:Transposase DDE domain